MRQITITRPDDWHIHLREGKTLSAVVAMTAQQMGRAIVMPNLSPPIKTVKEALDYRAEIINSLPTGSNFNPLMTLYLTDNTSQQAIIDASNARHVYAAKLYPAGATTNSGKGVSSLKKVYPVIDQMQKEGFPLLIESLSIQGRSS